MSVAGLFILKNWWRNLSKAGMLLLYIFLKMFHQVPLTGNPAVEKNRNKSFLTVEFKWQYPSRQ
jgi:hypothetical protein